MTMSGKSTDPNADGATSGSEPASRDRDASPRSDAGEGATHTNGTGADAGSTPSGGENAVSLDGLRVLVVEDDALIGMMLQDMVEDLGMSVVGHALNRADALRMVGEVEFDVAILDFNLGGQSSVPVAETLVAGARPFVFSTGYEAGYVKGFPGVPVVSKPYEMRRLGEALLETIADRRASGDGI